jgi:hypothetical protein
VPARSFKERRLRFGLPAKVDLDRNIKPENLFPRKPQFGVATAEQVHVSAHRDRIVAAIISLVIPKVCAIVLMLKIHDRCPEIKSADQLQARPHPRAPHVLELPSFCFTHGDRLPGIRRGRSFAVHKRHHLQQSCTSRTFACEDLVHRIKFI